MQKCVGLDLRRRPDRILHVIDALGADLVVLQEADKRLGARPAALPAVMARAAGWTVLPFAAPEGGDASLGWHGNAMLVRGDLRLVETARFDLPGLEPRGAIRADLETPIGPLRVIGVHLALLRRHRLDQVAHIMAELRHLPDRATVLAGDFNEWRGGTALVHAARGLSAAPTPPSYPAPRPVARLDRILHSPELHVEGTSGVGSRVARLASDHLPVWVDFARRSASATIPGVAQPPSP